MEDKMAASTSQDVPADLDYDPLTDVEGFAKALSSEPNSLEFTTFVHILVKEIKVYWKIKNNVMPLTDPERHNFFLVQLSCCLRELGCSYIVRIFDEMSSELERNDGQLLLLDYLMFKLLTARMTYANTPGSSSDNEQGPRQRTPATAQNLQDILSEVETFGLPVNMNTDSYLTMMENEIKNATERARRTKGIRKTLDDGQESEELIQLEKKFIRIVYKYKTKPGCSAGQK